MVIPHIPCYCQQGVVKTNDNTHQKNKIIFEDDFSTDSVGKFPNHWLLYASSTMDLNLKVSLKNTNGYDIAVRDTNGEHILEIHSHENNIPLAPDLDTTNYLSDTFNLEFDALTEKERCDVAVTFYDAIGNYIFYNRVFGTGEIQSVLSMSPDDTSFGHCPETFKYNVWHHYTYRYINPSISLYMDDDRIYYIPDCNFPPANLTITGNTYASGNPSVRFSNFKISTGPPGNELNRILTDKKFITHAIHFAVNKSTIMTSAAGFILQLAAWLKQNPAVKLEIDGHTDSDGDPVANLKLSLDRANEVIKQLTRYGIDKTRLTAKGFGSGKPLQLNNTPEGKENNRRVEFIKIAN